MSEEEREILQGLDDMKHLEINPEYKVKIINGILDLYNKEKEKNKELKNENEKLTYARNWYFEHFTSQACTPEQLHKILRFDYIPKSKVKKDLETCQKVYEEEMRPYQRDYGLDVTYLSKKEKEQLVNKRNCLITQMKTYEMLLEE